MKQDVKNLIDRLASKELTFGCEVQDTRKGAYNSRTIISLSAKRKGQEFYTVLRGFDPGIDILPKRDMQVLGHPILIGDVLEKLKGSYENPENLIMKDSWGVDVGDYNVAKLSFVSYKHLCWTLFVACAYTG